MLDVSGITKMYGERTVLDDVSVLRHARPPTRFSSAATARARPPPSRIVLGLLEKNGGEVALDGDPLTAARRRGFGYMPEERASTRR